MKRKGRSDGTIENYRDHVERLMAEWLDMPLSTLGNDPGLVTARHEKLTEENGSYIANGCMRTLRAIYNHARKTARALPADNPVSAVDWNGEYRRDTGLGLSELSGWFTELAALDNPVRREFHLFLLLIGKTAAQNVARYLAGDKSLPAETFVPVILANKRNVAEVQKELGQTS
jgi:hypothetical protein